MKILNYTIIFLCSLVISLLISEKLISQNYNTNNKVGIDIKGQVLKPGYYEISSDLKVIDAINYAGGLLDDADTSLINLSKTLEDEMVIIVYSQEEVSEMQEGSKLVKYINYECVCPNIENNACIELEYKNIDITQEKVNLNTSSFEELLTIVGIGEAKAKAIMEYRMHSYFYKIEDIMNIKGIGKATFEKLKDQITV